MSVSLVKGRRFLPGDAGCYLDGHMGWHNTYRVVDLATESGWTVPTDYVTALADYRENGYMAEGDSIDAMMDQGGLVEQATDYLNSLAPDGYVFLWDMGEFALVTEADAEMMI